MSGASRAKPPGNRRSSSATYRSAATRAAGSAGRDLAQAHGRGAHQQVGGRQRLGQAVALAGGERGDQTPGEALRARLEVLPRRAALGGGHRQAPTPVGRVRPDGDQAVVLQPGQDPAEVPGVQTETVAQLADRGAVRTDLVQDPRHPEGAAGAQERLVEHADALGVRAVEPAQGRGGGVLGDHSLTLVNDLSGSRVGSDAAVLPARCRRRTMDRLALGGAECHHPGTEAWRRHDERRPSPRRPARDRRGLRDDQRAGRLALAGRAARSGCLARHDPQRHGGPRGGGLHRPAAHLGRAGAHGQGLPAVRGPALGRQAAVRRRAARDLRVPHRRGGPRRRRGPLGAAAVPAHPPGRGRAVPVAGPLGRCGTSSWSRSRTTACSW